MLDALQLKALVAEYAPDHAGHHQEAEDLQHVKCSCKVLLFFPELPAIPLAPTSFTTAARRGKDPEDAI